MHCIGIDIAKNNHGVGIADGTGARIGGGFPATDTEAGFEKLLKRLAKAGVVPEDSVVGMEATGHCRIALCSRLFDCGFTVNVVNPINTDAFGNVSTTRTAKTGSVDAFPIADPMRFGSFAETHMAEEAMMALKQLTRHRRKPVGQRTSLKNGLTALLDQALPEHASIFSDMCGASSKKALAACPVPADIGHRAAKGSAKPIGEAGKGRLGYKKAEELKEAAENGFGARCASAALSFGMKRIVAPVGFMDTQIDELEAQIAKVLDETGTCLTTVPGIGSTYASAIVAGIGGIERFGSPAQIIAFAGMDVPANQSGGFAGSKKHMSKRGPPSLRWALIEAADKVRIRDPYFREYYESLRDRGKHHCVAQTAVARKLVNVIFVLLKEKRGYSSEPPKKK